MAQTLYATFSDPNRAQSAAAEMLENGIGKDEISLFVKTDHHVKTATDGVDLEDTRPTTPMKGTEFNQGPDPMGNGLRQLSVPRIERGLDADIKTSAIDSEEATEGPYLDITDSNEAEPFSRGFNAVGEASPPHMKVDPDAEGYAKAHGKSGAILAVSVYREELRGTVEEILQKHGAAEVESHQAYMS